MIMINDYDQKSYMIIYDIVMNMIDNHIICLLFQTLFWLSRQWSCCLVTGTFDWIWWKWMWILFICCCKFIWICCTWHICESIFRDAVRGVVVDDVFVRSQKYSFICIDLYLSQNCHHLHLLPFMTIKYLCHHHHHTYKIFFFSGAWPTELRVWKENLRRKMGFQFQFFRFPSTRWDCVTIRWLLWYVNQSGSGNEKGQKHVECSFAERALGTSQGRGEVC